MFIGRLNELNSLIAEFKNNKSTTLIYGKRRIGKTTLIKEASKNFNGNVIYYECIKSDLNDNLDNLINVIKETIEIPSYISFKSFINLFDYLNSLNEPILIIIDEYPYLKATSNDEYIDSIFQKIIDSNKSIHLVLSGSHISIMKSLLEEKNALFSRFSLVINLKELNYYECANFYENSSIEDKISFYSIFGGSPFINSYIDSSKSLKENIINSFLNEFNQVYIYVNNTLLSDLKNEINTNKILSNLLNGKKKYNELESSLNIKQNGLLSKHLNTLIDMEIIKKTYPINKKDNYKKTFYEINDNALRFYYTYIYKNKSIIENIGKEQFYDLYISKTLNHYISHRFEDISRQYFSILSKEHLIDDVYDIGTYYYDDSKNKTNGEFDCALKHQNSYSIFEVKFLSNPLSKKEIAKEFEQLSKIKGLNIKNIGFISLNGFEEIDNNYIYIEGKDLYNIKR